jgi:hypothetical protein
MWRRQAAAAAAAASAAAAAAAAAAGRRVTLERMVAAICLAIRCLDSAAAMAKPPSSSMMTLAWAWGEGAAATYESRV